MSKLTISIPEDTNAVLKDWAKQSERSLSNYIMCVLINITQTGSPSIYLPVEMRQEIETVQIPKTTFKRTDINKETGK